MGVSLHHCYQRQDWPHQPKFTVGRYSVLCEPLVDPQKVLVPPLDIKLGLNFSQLKKSSRQPFFLSYLRVKDSRCLHQPTEILEGKEVPKKLTREEKVAWNSFVTIVCTFLGNREAKYCVEPVETLGKNNGTMGCRICCLDP